MTGKIRDRNCHCFDIHKSQKTTYNKAGGKYTKTKRPVTLVYYEGYASKEEAMSREYAIKQLPRVKKLALMEF